MARHLWHMGVATVQTIEAFDIVCSILMEEWSTTVLPFFISPRKLTKASDVKNQSSRRQYYVDGFSAE